MKAFSRKASLFIVVALVLVLVLAACNRNGDDNGADDASYLGVEDDVHPQAGIHPVVDLGGRTILAGQWWDGVIPFAWDGDEPDPAESTNYVMDRMIWDNAQRVFRDFNFSIEEVILDYEYMLPTLTSSVMAGDPFADIVLLSGGMQLSAIRGDLIVPLEHLGLANSDVLGPQLYGHVFTHFEGYSWSFLNNIVEANDLFIGINLDIINAIGAQNPVDLYNRGQWTWENMLNIMRAATLDTTGDGTLDQWGISGQPGDIATHLIGANDGIMVSDDLQYAFDHPHTIAALEFMETIFHENLWQYNPAAGMDVGDWGTNWWAFLEGNSALFVAATWAMQGGDLPFDFAIVPFPLGPNNTSGNVGLSGWTQALVFPHGSSWNQAEILMVVEEFFSWPGDEPELMQEEGLAWPRGVFRTEDDVQRVAYIGRHRNRDIGMVVPEYSWVLGAFIQYFADREMTVLPAVESHRGPSQEILDNFFR